MHGCGTADQVHGSPRSDDVTGTRTPSQRPNRVALTLARVEVSVEHVGMNCSCCVRVRLVMIRLQLLWVLHTGRLSV